MQDEGIARIPLLARDGTIRAHASVDAESAAWLSQWVWRLNQSRPGYVRAARYELRDGRHTVFYMHREVLGLGPGHSPEVDHINHDALDNRRVNLRAIAHAANMQNRAKGYSATSEERGIRHKNGRWIASAKLDGHNHHVGTFDSEEDAARGVGLWRAAHMPFSQDALNAQADGLIIDPGMLPKLRPVTSSHRGVYWSRHKARWIAQVRFGARRLDLGRFMTELEAAEAIAQWHAPIPSQID